jgi:acetolactate synthase-1/2/3 large subunit
VALAERLEAPVTTTFQGKGVFPESHPLWLWPGFGAAAPAFVRKVAEQADVVLAIGCRFGEVATGSYGMEMPGPLVHVDIDPDVLGRNYPAEVAIHADSAAAVAGLLDRLRPKPGDRALRDRIAHGHRETEEAWRKHVSEDRVTPHALLRGIQNRFGSDTVFTTDSGNGTFLAMEILRLDRPRRFLAPVDYSCMGYSVPAGIGARLADPDAPVAVLAGDGAFLMTGLEMLAAHSHDIPVAVFVLRDRELAQIAQIQGTAFNRKTSSEVHDYDLMALCAGLHVDYLHLRTDDDVDETLERAATITGAGRPVVVEVEVDYSRKTYFTRGIVKTNLKRLPWKDRVRFVGRALARRVTG